MEKIAVLILADAESPGDMGRVVNGLEVAKEFQEAGDEVQVIFDGAGTRWIGTLGDPDHDYHELFEAVRPSITGACGYCAEAYGVENQVETQNIDLVREFDGHPSVRHLVTEGYQVLTF